MRKLTLEGMKKRIAQKQRKGKGGGKTHILTEKEG